MTNPINPANRTATNSVNSNTAKAQNKEPVASNPAASSPASKDTVSLSSQSQQVIELQQHLKNTSGIDSARVDAIKQEIALGNYPLDPEKIAENLINLEQSLIE